MENRKTVLLADANKEFRSMLQEVIEKTEEFAVVGSTGDGTEALQILEQRKPDVAVMDLVLPGTDGVSILRQLKAWLESYARQAAFAAENNLDYSASSAA